MELYTLNYDGSCWPNPGGKAACGYILKYEGKEIKSETYQLGSGATSNNLAEFMGAARGLEYFLSIMPDKSCGIQVLGDSQFVYWMMGKKYKPNHNKLYYPGYVALDVVVKKLRAHSVAVLFDWIPRELNADADKISR